MKVSPEMNKSIIDFFFKLHCKAFVPTMGNLPVCFQKILMPWGLAPEKSGLNETLPIQVSYLVNRMYFVVLAIPRVMATGMHFSNTDPAK